MPTLGSSHKAWPHAAALAAFGAIMSVSACTPLNLGPTAAPGTTDAPTEPPPISVPTAGASAPGPAPTLTTDSAVVALIQDGDIRIWEEATGHSRTLFDGGDAIDLTLSDDGQVLAFLRRSIVQLAGDPAISWREQSGLWVMDRNGENLRELVPADELRRLLHASDTDSTNVPQMAWVLGSHRLLYTGWTYIVQAEGESHATPAGLFSVDADSGASATLLPISENLRFAPSPDGQHVALISLTGLSFLDLAAGAHSPDVLTYPRVGLEVAFPSGVWAQDSTAFVITGPIDEAAGGRSDLSIWRAPVGGSPAQWLAGYSDSHSDSVTFSPDGRYAAYFKSGSLGSGGQATDFGWFITPLAGGDGAQTGEAEAQTGEADAQFGEAGAPTGEGEARSSELGALAAPYSAHLFWQDVHWSPAGAAYAVRDGTLVQLCPGASQDAEACSQVLELGDRVGSVSWIDGERFLWTTREPYDLHFGRTDGVSVRLAEGAERFAALAQACQNDAAQLSDGSGPDAQQVAPDTLFARTWRVQNTGTCAWDTSYRLAFLGGDRMSGPRSFPLAEAVPPGEEIALSVKLISPTVAGSYRGTWQLLAPDGSPFGPAHAVEVGVPFGVPTALTPGQIVAQVATGGRPSRVAIGEGAAWATSEAARAVYRIDLESNRLAATIPVSGSPRSVAVGYGAVWVAHSGEGTVTRIDPVSNRVGATISISNDPFAGSMGIAAGADGIWVAIGITGGDHGMVVRIDPAVNQVTASITVERWPWGVAATEQAVWITHSVSPMLTRIDPATNQVAATIELECPTIGLAADASGVWAACASAPTLFRIDPATDQVVAGLAVGQRSGAIALGRNAVWVASEEEGTLTLIDPDLNRAVHVFAIGDGPLDVAAFGDEGWLVAGGAAAVWRIKP